MLEGAAATGGGNRAVNPPLQPVRLHCRGSIDEIVGVPGCLVVDRDLDG